MKEDLMASFKRCRDKFNCENKRVLSKMRGPPPKDDPNNYEIALKDDEIGLEDLARYLITLISKSLKYYIKIYSPNLF